MFVTDKRMKRGREYGSGGGSHREGEKKLGKKRKKSRVRTAPVERYTRPLLVRNNVTSGRGRGKKEQNSPPLSGIDPNPLLTPDLFPSHSKEKLGFSLTRKRNSLSLSLEKETRFPWISRTLIIQLTKTVQGEKEKR